jgi:hypothetical protein
MTVDWTKPIEDVNGNPARVLSDDFRSARCSSHILHTLRIVQVEFEFRSELWYVDDDGSNPGGGELIRNRKVKKKGWVNLYHTPYAPVKYCCGATVYDTEKTAKDNIQRGHDTYAATIKIEWEE